MFHICCIGFPRPILKCLLIDVRRFVTFLLIRRHVFYCTNIGVCRVSHFYNTRIFSANAAFESHQNPICFQYRSALKCHVWVSISTYSLIRCLDTVHFNRPSDPFGSFAGSLSDPFWFHLVSFSQPLARFSSPLGTIPLYFAPLGTLWAPFRSLWNQLGFKGLPKCSQSLQSASNGLRNQLPDCSDRLPY